MADHDSEYTPEEVIAFLEADRPDREPRCSHCDTTGAEWAYRGQPLCIGCTEAFISWFQDGGWREDPLMFDDLLGLPSKETTPKTIPDFAITVRSPGERTDKSYPGVDTSGANDHGIVRRLP